MKHVSTLAVVVELWVSGQSTILRSFRTVSEEREKILGNIGHTKTKSLKMSKRLEYAASAAGVGIPYTNLLG